MNDSTDAYPLCWPLDQPRHTGSRERGTFKGTICTARDGLLDELDRLLLAPRNMTWRRSIIVSSNLPLRNDGMIRADAREPGDPGIAVYFTRKGRKVCFACDKYDRTWKNMRAIEKTIEAMRGIERWGSAEMLDRAFTGFAALPAPGISPWWEVMGMNGTESVETIRSRYREMAKRCHPDSGGSHQQMAELNEAYEIAIK